MTPPPPQARSRPPKPSTVPSPVKVGFPHNNITVESDSIVIAACDRSGAWDVALMMLDDAREEEDGGDGGNEGGGVKAKGKANVFAYTAAVSACGKAGRWEEAVGLLDVRRRVSWGCCGGQERTFFFVERCKNYQVEVSVA